MGWGYAGSDVLGGARVRGGVTGPPGALLFDRDQRSH